MAHTIARPRTSRHRKEAALSSGMACLTAMLRSVTSSITTLSEEKQMPYEQIRKAYEFPFDLRPYQIERVNAHCPSDTAGLFWQPGVGKTAGSTHWALYRSFVGAADQWVVLMPPILLDQWAAFLGSIKSKETGLPLEAVIYAGTPKRREQLRKLGALESDFILMSYSIFKNDFEILYNHLDGRSVGTMCDEGHAIKNIESQTHKAVKLFSEGRQLAILTGTPLTTPADAYAYIRLLAPGVYRNQRHFEKLHVGERDEYDKVTEWINLDVLEANLKINTSRVLRRAVQKEIPPIIYNRILYSLDPAHEKLYNRIAEERLVALEAEGTEIDAISAQALRSALQQVVMNWGEFAGDLSLKPRGLELVEEVLDEIGPHAKLLVVANFRRTNRYLVNALQGYNAVAVYGEISPAQKTEAIAKFIHDPSCRVMLAQYQSAGFGVDGLQHVCSDMLILEAPPVPPPFHQVVARLDRDGQQNPVNCRIAVASRTVQVRLFRDLLEKDERINAVQGGYKDLKESIFGH